MQNEQNDGLRTECVYCHWLSPGHAVGCPKEFGVIDSERVKLYKKGYDDGRMCEDPKANNPTYKIGWNSGDSAADAAENDVR